MGDDGYDVDGAELRDGSSFVQLIIGNVDDGETGAVDAQYGHAVLHQAVAGFCDAMNTAVAAMLAQTSDTSDGLAATALTYSADDASAWNQVGVPVAELGETSDPVALVPGSPDGVDGVAAVFTARGRTSARSAGTCR